MRKLKEGVALVFLCIIFVSALIFKQTNYDTYAKDTFASPNFTSIYQFWHIKLRQQKIIVWRCFNTYDNSRHRQVWFGILKDNFMVNSTQLSKRTHFERGTLWKFPSSQFVGNALSKQWSLLWKKSSGPGTQKYKRHYWLWSLKLHYLGHAILVLEL